MKKLLGSIILTILLLQCFCNIAFKSTIPNPHFSKSHLQERRKLQSAISPPPSLTLQGLLNTNQDNEEIEETVLPGDLYTITGSVGSQNIPVTFLIDSTSNSSWISSLSNYLPMNSNTSVNISNATSTVSGYRGLIEGQLIQDIININGVEFNISFVYTTSVDPFDQEYQNYVSLAFNGDSQSYIYNGVLGLAPPITSSNSSIFGQNSPLNSLNDIEEEYFSLYYEADPYGGSHSSFLTLSGYSNSYMTSTGFNIVPVIDNEENNGTWSFELGSYTLTGWQGNNQSFIPSNTIATIATGNQYIGIPQNDFNQVMSTLQNTLQCSLDVNNNYGCLCSNGNLGLFPTISLQTGSGVELNIAPWSYVLYYPSASYNCMIYNDYEGCEDEEAYFSNYDRVLQFYEEEEDDDEEEEEEEYEEEYEEELGFGPYGIYYGPFFPYYGFQGSSNQGGLGDYCQILIQPVNSSFNYGNPSFYNNWILGIPFLQNYYTVFNSSNDTLNLGFATASQPELTSYTPPPQSGPTPPNSPSATGDNIWGIVIGVIAAVLVILLVISCLQSSTKHKRSGETSSTSSNHNKKKKKKSKKNRNNVSEEVIITQAYIPPPQPQYGYEQQYGNYPQYSNYPQQQQYGNYPQQQQYGGYQQ